MNKFKYFFGVYISLPQVPDFYFQGKNQKKIPKLPEAKKPKGFVNSYF
jgi:hypothetical protein